MSLRKELVRPGCWAGSTAPTPCSASRSLSLGAAGGVLAARYRAHPFWCSFVAMTVLTLACWPILSSQAVAQARAQAATEQDRP